MENGLDLTAVKQVFQLISGEALGGQQVNILRRIPEGQRHGFQFIQMGRAFCRMGEAAAVGIIHQEPGVSAPEQLAVIKGLSVEPPGLVDPQNLSALDRNLPALSEGRLNFPESLTKNVLRGGIEIEADVMLKGTRVDGIYTADPEKDKTAVKFDKISYDEIYTRGLKVMDLTATTLCKENRLPIIVFDMDTNGNLKKVLTGENIGTLVY